ncbi:hypothetical protein J2Z22_000996 [Paenibacillus forsythiae]|uniref:DUF4878 domain-containing protein n=1 Tax=Paenibacillus forsythiae TaxID=365616 RepID=A0ABU3H410_9BACL|nr:hypothetical protein [Paenibacillus forsythiae]MDT3425480.1 hypothetical protein [Paenibacillus forsythiae]
MKKIIQMFAVFSLVGLLMISSVNAAQVNSTDSKGLGQASPKTALKVANDYFTAYISQDVEGQIANAVDTNYLDEKSRRAGLVEFADVNVTDYKILSYKEVSDTQIDLSVQLVYPSIPNYPSLPFSVIKYEDGWKVLIKAYDVNLDTTSPDYGTIKAGLPLYKKVTFNQDLVQSRTVMLDYYAFSGLGQGTVLLGEDTFNIASGNTTVTINGWQTVDQIMTSAWSPGVKYAIVTVSGSTTNWFGQKTINDIISQNDVWYTEYITLTQAPISNARIQITGTGSYCTMEGAGNVYAIN